MKNVRKTLFRGGEHITTGMGRDFCNGVLQLWRENKLKSEYDRGKWEFITKEQVQA